MDLVPASSNSGLLLSTAAFSTCPVYLLLAAWAIGKAVISAQLLASTVWATSQYRWSGTIPSSATR
ncbi:hypothetical protein [Amycolatopsis echigonensis]|uniref:Uncharacterized protein n=1 Tax=Amycolatopsis echigonensis TaxID=2576905 RepID=A0A8E1VU95_9PSEU|nr:hypothetical protein [Amycolatopsis echigonensis]MBB2498412.1 hypothetical protein [Amycolatopsis echigonensis]